MASVPCNSMLLLTTLVAVLVSCDGRPNSPDFTSYFTSPTTLRVEWSTGTDDGGGTVNGYRLHYRLGPKGKMVKLKIPQTPLTYDIQGLQACGNYFVRMATSATTGLSRYSSFAAAERVASSPTNLNVVAQSGTSAMVNWTPPAKSACIDGYRLQYGPSENDLITIKLPADLDQYILADLQPSTSYLLTLAATANNFVGDEEYSQWYQAGPPIAPTNLQANPTSPETAIITWSPTSSGLSGYNYLYGPLGTPDKKLAQGNLGPSSMLLELEGLDPGTEYVIKVSSVNSVGESSAASLVWSQPGPTTQKPPQVPLPAAPGQVSVRSNSPQTAIITWTRPEGNIHIVGYIVGFGLSSASQGDLTLTSIASDELAFEVEGLKVGTRYRATVQAYNNDGDGPAGMAQWRQEDVPMQLSVPTQPRGVLAYSSSPSSIDISWMLSEVTGPISQFQVSYGSNPTADELVVEVGGDSDSVEIHDLKPDSLYYFKIYAVNAAGRSGAVSRSVQTLDLPPEERCGLQQRACMEQFGPSPSDTEDGATVCPRILQNLNCLQLLRDTCMHDEGYRDRVNGVRETFLRRSCNRNPIAPAPEVIAAPTNLQTAIVSPSSTRLSWTDESLGESQIVSDHRFYNIRYRITEDDRYLEERTRETSYVLESLQPGVPYEFTVQLILDPQRRSPLSEPIVAASRDPAHGGIPERFTVLQVMVSSPTTAKAILNWLPPPERGAPKNYIVEYTDSEDFREPTTMWERMTIPGTQLSAVIGDLSSDQEYHARITAEFSSSEMGPQMASPATFTTPVIPPSPNVGKQCDETQEQGVTRRVNFLWDGVVDGVQRPPLYGVPIPYCQDEYSVEECHGIFCFCIPGKKPPALRQPQCLANLPPCRREYNLARKALDEARQQGVPAMSAMLPHCKDDGFYHPKQCSGTMCYCVTENGAHTGQERPLWEAARLRC